MNNKTRLRVAALMAIGILAFQATAADAEARSLNQAKVRRGAWIIPTAPDPGRAASTAAAAARRGPNESPLELRLHRATAAAAVAGQEPPAIHGAAGEELQLTLEITNRGPATEVKLAALTAGLKVTLPSSVVVEANATTTVDVRATIRDCGPRPNLIVIFARNGQPGTAGVTKTLRSKVHCR